MTRRNLNLNISQLQWRALWIKVLIAALLIGQLQPLFDQTNKISAAPIDPANLSLISMGSNYSGQLGRDDSQALGIVNALAGKSIKSVSTGLGISLVLTEDAEVYTFGILNPEDSSHQPRKLEGIPSAVAISANLSHALIATVNGSVYAMGENRDGQLGLDGTGYRREPVQVPGLTNVIAVEAGGSFSLALTKLGEVYAFGQNTDGQLGIGSTDNKITVPTRITIKDQANNDVSNQVKAISAGYNHALLLLQDGRVFSFGNNTVGQLGLGAVTWRSISPQQIKNPSSEGSSSWSGWAAIDASRHFSYVQANDGTLYSFGSNSDGQLGFNGESLRSYATPNAISFDINPADPIASFSAGNYYALFVTSSGKLYGTGSLSFQDPHFGRSFIPVAIRPELQVQQVSAGYNYALFTGSISGTVSPESTSFNTFPADQQDIEVQLSPYGNELTGIFHNGNLLLEGTQYSLDGNTVTLHKSYLSTFEVGKATFELRFNKGNSPILTIDVVNVPQSLILTTNAVFDTNSSRQQPVEVELELNGNDLTGIEITNEDYDTTATLTEGDDYTIEDNIVTITSNGLSDWYTGDYLLHFTFSSGKSQSIPLVIKYSNDSYLNPNYTAYELHSQTAENIEIEIELNGNHLLNIENDGILLIEGTDYLTEEVNEYTLQVTLLKDYLLTLTAGKTTLTFYFNGGEDSKFDILKSSGIYGEKGIYAFGDNGYYQLGLEDDYYRLHPTYVEALRGERIESINAGNFFSLALTENGKVYLFADIFASVSGSQNTVTHLSDLPPIKSIAAGSMHALMLSNNGEVYGWGMNSDGQLGSEPTGAEDDFKIAPQKIEGLSDIQEISAGSFHSLALTDDGKVYVFGRNALGQLGVVTNTDNITEPVLLAEIPAIQATTAGAGHSLLLTEDGRVLSFGAGTSGQLGLGDWNNRSEPTFIEGVSDITAIAAGGEYNHDGSAGEDSAYGHTLLLTRNGGVISFGEGWDGQLGHGTEESINVPALIDAELPRIKAIAAGAWHTLLLSEGNEVYSFGYNGEGQLGFGHNNYSVIFPTKNERLTGAAGIAAGAYHSFVWFKEVKDGGSTEPGNNDGGGGSTEPGNNDGGGGSTEPGNNNGGGGSTKPGNNNGGGGSTEPGNNNGGITVPGSSNEAKTDNLSDGVSLKELLSKLQSAPSSADSHSFADTASHWAKAPILWFAKYHLAAGYTDNSFKPNQSITRAEFVTLLTRLFTIDPAANDASFTDIQNSWAKDAITAFANAGLINGYSDGTFRPNQKISREEMVVILSRLLQLSALQSGSSISFTDINHAAAYAQEAIRLTAGAGIIQGAGNNSFNPKGDATRAETIQVLFNTLKLLPELKEWLK